MTSAGLEPILAGQRIIKNEIQVKHRKQECKSRQQHSRADSSGKPRRQEFRKESARKSGHSWIQTLTSSLHDLEASVIPLHQRTLAFED